MSLLPRNKYGPPRAGGPLVAQPMDIEEMYSHEHDELGEAERVAGVYPPGMWAPPGKLWAGTGTPQTQWHAMRFEEHVATGSTNAIRRDIRAKFRPRWLIVATRGFTVRLQTYSLVLLDDVDGDLFMGSAWDAAATTGQMMRFGLPDAAIDVGNQLFLYVTPRPRLLTIKGQLIRFSAMVIGDEHVSRY